MLFRPDYDGDTILWVASSRPGLAGEDDSSLTGLVVYADYAYYIAALVPAPP